LTLDRVVPTIGSEWAEQADLAAAQVLLRADDLVGTSITNWYDEVVLGSMLEGS